jgi:hypothetical protein
MGGLLCINDGKGEPLAWFGSSATRAWGAQLAFLGKPGIVALQLSGSQDGGIVSVFGGEQPGSPAGEFSGRHGGGSLVLRGPEQQVLFAKP